jgi:hypothetical protein
MAVSPHLTPPTALAGLCACGHPEASHDRVGIRYCAAVAADPGRQGCICVPAGGTSTDKLYDSHGRG